MRSDIHTLGYEVVSLRRHRTMKQIQSLPKWAMLLAVTALSTTGLVGCGGEGELGGSSDSATTIGSNRPFAYVVRDFPSMPNLTANQLATERPPLDPRAPYQFNPGAQLIVKSFIGSSADGKDVLRNYFGGAGYDVKDLDVSPDGRFLVFAAHGQEGNAHDNSWNIYEYSFDSGKVRRIFKNDAFANKGQDTNPAYTNDGEHIVFSSDRQVARGDFAVEDNRQYLYGYNEPASLMHYMKRDGSGLIQVSEGEFHEIEPDTTYDGRIVFIRFGREVQAVDPTSCDLDAASSDPNYYTKPGGSFGQGGGGSTHVGVDKPWVEEDFCLASTLDPTTNQQVFVRDILSLYRMSPLGGNLHRYYGGLLSEQFTSASLIHYMDPIPLDDGNLMSIKRYIFNPFYGGDVIKVNSKDFYAVDRPLDASVTGVAESSMTPGDVSYYPTQSSPAGWYSAVAPYHDGSNRLLAAWSPCLAGNGDGTAEHCASLATNMDLVDPLYGIWVVDPNENTRLPVVRSDRKVLYTDIAVGKNTEEFKGINLGQRQGITLDKNEAAFLIHSIYDVDGNDAAERAGISGGIAELRDPSLYSPDQRSERFIRVIGKRYLDVGLRDDIIASNFLNGTPETGLKAIFGASTDYTLYDVLSYANVQPDGSAAVKVPADVPLTFEVVNKKGKRVNLIAEHGYGFNYLNKHGKTLSLSDGEVLTCTGCHEDRVADPTEDAQAVAIKNEDNLIRHSRADIAPDAVANPGAPASGMPFPNANPDLYAYTTGATMAETLIDHMGLVDVYGADIFKYIDRWTADPAIAAGNDFANYYADLPYYNHPNPGASPSLPVAEKCLSDWTPDCKSTINYFDHIQTLWGLCRSIPQISSTQTYSCVSCHEVEGSQGNTAQPWAPCDRANGNYRSDFELESDTIGYGQWVMPKSYIKLTSVDQYFKYSSAGGKPSTDPTAWTQTTYDQCPLRDGSTTSHIVRTNINNVQDGDCYGSAPMNANGAIASGRFFGMFETDNDPDDNIYEHLAPAGNPSFDHHGLLNEAELRLIAEWLDQGAHLYNDTTNFVIPEAPAP